jgi:hypothetical protein
MNYGYDIDGNIVSFDPNNVLVSRVVRIDEASGWNIKLTLNNGVWVYMGDPTKEEPLDHKMCSRIGR